jgi:hypothetical protein
MELFNLDLGSASFTSTGSIDADLITATDLMLDAATALRFARIGVTSGFTGNSDGADIAFLTALLGTEGDFAIADANAGTLGFETGALTGDGGDFRVIETVSGASEGRLVGAGSVEEMVEVGGDLTLMAATGVNLTQTMLDPDLNTEIFGSVSIDNSGAGDIVVEADSALELHRIVNAGGDLTLRTNSSGASTDGSQSITQTVAADSTVSVSGETTLITGSQALDTSPSDVDAPQLADILLTANPDDGTGTNRMSGEIFVLGNAVTIFNEADTTVTATFVNDALTISSDGDAVLRAYAEALGLADQPPLALSGPLDIFAEGEISLGDTAVDSTVTLISTGSVGPSDITFNHLDVSGFLFIEAQNGNVQLEPGGGDTPADDFLMAGSDAVIVASGFVEIDNDANDFQARLALVTGEGPTVITDANDLNFGIPQTQTLPTGSSASTLQELVQTALGGDAQLTHSGNTVGVVGDSWTLTAGGDILFDGALDADIPEDNDLIINPGFGIGDVHFSDYVGGTQVGGPNPGAALPTHRLGNVTITGARDVSFGDLGGIPELDQPNLLDLDLDADILRDVFFARALVFQDISGNISVPRLSETDLQYETADAFFGINISNGLAILGLAEDSDVDLPGAIGGFRDRTASLRPNTGGIRNLSRFFNNCVIGDLSVCTSEVPPVSPPDIDLSVPSIFDIDFEALGDVYANFGNENLWVLPGLFAEEEEEEEQSEAQTQ